MLRCETVRAGMPEGCESNADPAMEGEPGTDRAMEREPGTDRAMEGHSEANRTSPRKSVAKSDRTVPSHAVTGAVAATVGGAKGGKRGAHRAAAEGDRRAAAAKAEGDGSGSGKSEWTATAEGGAEHRSADHSEWATCRSRRGRRECEASANDCHRRVLLDVHTACLLRKTVSAFGLSVCLTSNAS
jgi:hypothetical protein